MSYKWIRASEIPDYVYCRRAWWLQRVAGHTSANVREMRRGSDFHEQHGLLLQQASWQSRLAYALLFIVVSFVVFTILMNL